MVVVAIICAQIIAKNIAPITNEIPKTLSYHSSNYENPNIHVWFFLSFCLTYINFAVRSSISTSTPNGNINHKDMAYTLAYKVFNMPIFFNIDLLVSKFKPTWIF